MSTGRHALNRSTRLTGAVDGVRVSATISGRPDAVNAVTGILAPLVAANAREEKRPAKISALGLVFGPLALRNPGWRR